MKILIVGGAVKQWMSLELIYKCYLLDDIECEIYPIQNYFRAYYYKNISNKILFKAGLSGVYRELNIELLNYVRDFRPNIVWVFKGMEIFPETLAKMKEMKILLCNFNPDHPFIFSGAGSGNRNVRNGFTYFDAHFIYSWELYEKCLQTYPNIFFHLPFAYDLSHLDAEEIMTQDEEFKHACFIGNPDKERASFIKQLSKRGIQLDVYGNDWNRFIDQSRYLKIHRPVYGMELWKTFRKYRIQLNLLRKHNQSSHNQRTFELAGCGSIQIAPSTVDHQKFFNDGETIFLFDSIKECEEKISAACNLQKKEADAIRARVKLKCDADGHTYRSRAKYVLKKLSEIHD